MTLESIIFILVAGSAFGISGYRLHHLFQLMMHHQGKAKPIDQISKRIWETVINVFGQKAVLKKRLIGLIHSVIFWGFLMISIGTLEQFLTTLYAPLSFEHLLGLPFYTKLILVQDWLTVGVILAVFYAFYRRLVIKPKSLGQSSDALWILTFTSTLMVSILFMNAFLILGQSPSFSQSMPFSQMLANVLAHLHLEASQYIMLSQGFKWIHMLIVFGFSIYIPGSKHLHIIAAGPNTFFQHLGREKAMKTISFEDESVTSFGTSKVTDLSWKDALDYYSCTECGRCQDLCPAFNTDKPLSPKKLITDLKHNLLANKNAVLKKDYASVTPVLDSHISEDVIWACTSCRACEIACPVFIEHTDKIYDIRRNLVMMEAKFPAEMGPIFTNLENNASPWAFSRSDRAQWAEGLPVPLISQMSDEQRANLEVLLWVGCAGSFDDRNKKVLKAFVSLLTKANIAFGILGNEEQCTGDPARRMGNEYLYQTLAKGNIETLNKYKIQKIVTSCPHCLNTIKNEYPDFGGKFEVHHHSQFLSSLIASGRLKPSVEAPASQSITFHDSCYLGRWNNIYSAPREVLQALPSTHLIEMKQNHDQSLCCGAGGGRMWMEEKIGTRINVARTEQALETKADIVASSCPFCMTMLTDGLKAHEKQDQVKVLDIAELLDQRVSS